MFFWDGAEVRQRLPSKKVLQIGNYRVGLMHGKFKLDEQRERLMKEFGSVDLIVYGHSHRPFWGNVIGIYFLNPGSPADIVHAQFHSVAILEAGEELKARIIEI